MNISLVISKVWFIGFISYSLHPDLVVAILGDVSHPRKCLVSTLFDNLEVTDLHTRHCKVRYFELELDRYSTVFLSLFRLDGWETELGSHEEFFTTCKLLDAPDH